MLPSFKFYYLCVNMRCQRASRVVVVVASHAKVADIRARKVAQIFGFSPDQVTLTEVQEIPVPVSMYLDPSVACSR